MRAVRQSVHSSIGRIRRVLFSLVLQMRKLRTGTGRWKVGFPAACFAALWCLDTRFSAPEGLHSEPSTVTALGCAKCCSENAKYALVFRGTFLSLQGLRAPTAPGTGQLSESVDRGRSQALGGTLRSGF